MVAEKDFIELAKRGTEAEVKAALAADPTLATANEDGVSAILCAVYHGHADNARAIANAKGEIDIFEAAALGDQHVTDEILKKTPAAINEFSADGFTPLGLAAYFGHRELVQKLLAAGADPTIASKNALGVIPLHSALSNGHKEIARILVEAGRPGTQVNTPTRQGWFPLHYTAHSGDWETSDFLLMHGASTSQVNNIGETPAMEARTHGYSALADILE
jgi:ankyrin repeat protein